MAIDLADYDIKTKEAVKIFWRSREEASKKQIESGKTDKGERAGVTAGKNMDGFIDLGSSQKSMKTLILTQSDEL